LFKFVTSGAGMPVALRRGIQVRGLVLTAPGQISLQPFELPPLDAGSVRIRVAGCGLCHTDISFYSGQVRTRHPLPLVLGHEIAGTVVAAAPDATGWIGQDVIVPAVIPCGSCQLCRTGHDNACLQQVMPGNHSHGGFATEVVVPARSLVRLGPDRGGYDLAELAVVADAVTTPYQAMRRAGVAAGDVVIVIGAGGIGTYAVQIARALGARVGVIDIDGAKLDRLAPFGAEWRLNAREMDGAAIKKHLLAATGGTGWKIFEMSGTLAGQELAWSLLVPAATLGVIGFTMDKPQVRLSNLMALDATAFGSWGCSPSLYPAALALVCSGQVTLRPFIEWHPLADGPALFEQQAHGAHAGGRRAILIPDPVEAP
jgi:6-hydroxycyclohex-1-ene-1-carbonyl-CoA dehydrogenase